ncbi:MAG: YkgJ family cysteine cluster protein, partial [Candidatus Omnitrophica bacterium]|nr:YkgJ family cysteine cluster protein [Candidatus Omnitrophota bacterium]
KQFVPSEYCLKCKGCCRFKEADSVWTPCLLDEEVQLLLDKKIPPAAMSRERKLMVVPDPSGEGFLCPFFKGQENKCQIYEFRPFECRLYPFLLNMRNKKILLTVDLNCPYIKEKINTQEFKEYAGYLADFLNLPQQLKMLKDNPQILQAYEDVAQIMELDI